MPFVHVRMTGKATPEQKDEVIAGITGVLQSVLGKDPAVTHIVLEEVADENWGARGTSVATRKKTAG
jgi:4-oxalocrotonate tautomerase